MKTLIHLIAIFILFQINAAHAQAQDASSVVPNISEDVPADQAASPVLDTPVAQPAPEGSVSQSAEVAALPPATEALAAGVPEKEIMDQISLMKPDINVNLIPPLFFSRWEHDLIQDARRGLVTRPPESIDDFAAEPIAPEETGPMPRNVSLAGIVYRSNKDWVIWLNNRRILPNAIPTEILDLQVYKDHIKLEWFDKDTNQVFPIKLRPHQTFNLDTRIFLPG